MLLLPHFVHILVDVLKKSFTKKKSTDSDPPSFTHDKGVKVPHESSLETPIPNLAPDSAEISLTQQLKLKPDTKIYHLPLFTIHCPFCPLPINSAHSTISVFELVSYTSPSIFKLIEPSSSLPRSQSTTDRLYHGLIFKQPGNLDTTFIPDEQYKSIGYPSNKFTVETDEGFKKMSGGSTYMDVVNDCPVICSGCGQEALSAMEIEVRFKRGGEQAKKWGEGRGRFLLVGPAEWAGEGM